MSAYNDIIARLIALHPKRIDLSLDRMWRILERLGHPERHLPPVIHVAGCRPQRPCLHVAASGPFQRALSPGCARRRQTGQR